MIRDGIPYFTVEIYGFKTIDPQRPQKMLKAARVWVRAEVRGEQPR